MAQTWQESRIPPFLRAFDVDRKCSGFLGGTYKALSLLLILNMSFLEATGPVLPFLSSSSSILPISSFSKQETWEPSQDLSTSYRFRYSLSISSQPLFQKMKPARTPKSPIVSLVVTLPPLPVPRSSIPNKTLLAPPHWKSLPRSSITSPTPTPIYFAPSLPSTLPISLSPSITPSSTRSCLGLEPAIASVRKLSSTSSRAWVSGGSEVRLASKRFLAMEVAM